MDAQLTLTSKQRLIDIFAELYSQEDIFAIGRLVGIDKNQYYGFGMNGVQLAEAFINAVVQKEKVQLMFEIMDEKKEYYRSALNEFIPYSEVNKKNLKNGLKAIENNTSKTVTLKRVNAFTGTIIQNNVTTDDFKE